MAERVQTARDERGWFSSPAGIGVLWAGILAGPITWALDLTVSYALVKWTCGHRSMLVLHLITLAALLTIAAGAVSSWRAFTCLDDGTTGDGPRPMDRGRFMALLGLLMCAAFALAVIGNQ